MKSAAAIRYPTPSHRRVLSAILADARANPGVRGPLLTGSLARGTARADSDLDVLVITSEQATDDGWRSAARPLPANFAARTPRRMARVLRPGPARR